MSERGNGVGGGATLTTGRHSRVSPSPGRGTKIAYTQLPTNDPYEMKQQRNCLAIPMSTLQTLTTNTNGAAATTATATSTTTATITNKSQKSQAKGKLKN